jgi:hypothetical protein
MSIREKRCETADSALRYLESLLEGDENIIFRGHSNSNHTIQASYNRYTSMPPEISIYNLGEMLDRFRAGLIKNDLLPFESDNREDWLVFARHHNIPTPCIDFTMSPYIALFFAFNKVRTDYKSKKSKYSVVYALDVSKLAHDLAIKKVDPKINEKGYYKAYHEFLRPPLSIFENHFPPEILLYIPFPSKHNIRMQRQQGVMIYDTIDYQKRNLRDFESYVKEIKEPDTHEPNGKITKNYTITKVFINQKCVADILERLELMNINGGALFSTPEGVAMDVENMYSYNTRTHILRGDIPNIFK